MSGNPLNPDANGSDYSSVRDNATFVESEYYSTLGVSSRHIPHRSLIFEKEYNDDDSLYGFGDDIAFQDSYGLDNPDLGRGYASTRTLLNPKGQNSNYGFDVSEPFRGHRPTLSLLGTNRELGLRRYDCTSSALSLNQGSDFGSQLLSEPPLFSESEGLNHYMRSPPPFPAPSVFSERPSHYRMNSCSSVQEMSMMSPSFSLLGAVPETSVSNQHSRHDSGLVSCFVSFAHFTCSR